MLMPVKKSRKILFEKLESLDLKGLKNAIINYNHSSEKSIGGKTHKDDVCEMVLDTIDLLCNHISQLKRVINYLGEKRMEFQGKEKLQGRSKSLDKAFDEANLSFDSRIKILQIIKSCLSSKAIDPSYGAEEYINLLELATNEKQLDKN